MWAKLCQKSLIEKCAEPTAGSGVHILDGASRREPGGSCSEDGEGGANTSPSPRFEKIRYQRTCPPVFHK
jgi:hypothetical protein